MATYKQVAYIESLINAMDNPPYLAKGEQSREEMEWMMDAIEPRFNRYSIIYDYDSIRTRYLARIAELRAMDWDAMNNGKASQWIDALKQCQLVIRPSRARRAR